MAQLLIEVNLAGVELPKFTEPRGGEGLILYGEDNLYPDYLIDLYLGSPKHNSIINHKVRYATGAGFAAKVLGKSMPAISGFSAIINDRNKKGEDLNSIVKRCALDYEIHNAIAIEMIWLKNGKKAIPYYIQWSLLRTVLMKDGSFKYCYLPNWTGVRSYDAAKSKKEFREFDLYGTNKTGSEILVYKESRPVKSGESDAYPIPYYIGAIPYIECDVEVASYCLNGIHNDFSGSKMITLTNGMPETPEKQRAVEDKFKRKHTGAKGNRRILLNFVDNADQKPIIDELGSDDIGAQFEILNKQIREELFTAHNITDPTLFGIPNPSGAFSKDETNEKFRLFTALWTTPRQVAIIAEFNRIFTEQGLTPELYLQAVKPAAIQLSEQALMQLLSADDLKNIAYEQTGITRKEDKVSGTGMKLSAELSDEDNFLKHFKENSSDENENWLDSFKVELNESGQPIHSDSGFKAMYFAKIFDLSLTDNEADIMSGINSNSKISIEDLATALDLPSDEVEKIIDKLKGLKILSGDIGENIKVTKKGVDIADESDKSLTIDVVYTYTDEGAPKLRKGSVSRPFCQELMVLARSGKTWTRKQIDAIKNDDGKSAWVYRGGFYHNESAGETTPFCRHHWKAVIRKTKG